MEEGAALRTLQQSELAAYLARQGVEKSSPSSSSLNSLPLENAALYTCGAFQVIDGSAMNFKHISNK